MDGDREKAERYRVRAEEVRAIAETMTDPATKKILTGVADDYVSMAESLDRIVERDKLLKSP